jgi:hypothetical protein
MLLVQDDEDGALYRAGRGHRAPAQAIGAPARPQRQPGRGGRGGRGGGGRDDIEAILYHAPGPAPQGRGALLVGTRHVGKPSAGRN